MGRFHATGLAILAVAAMLSASAAAKPEGNPSLNKPQGTPSLNKPQRIASLNLCTDQLLLMLVEPERIVTVTFLATDPESSYMAHATTGIPINHGRLEQILPLKPDLVLTGRFTTHFTKALLRKLGYTVYEAGLPTSFEAIRAQVREVAELLGESPKGEELLVEMEAQLARSARISGNRPLAALYGPRGYSQGKGTLEDSVLQAAGYRNLTSEMGLTGSRVLPLEILLRQSPHYLIFNARVDRAPSLAMAVLDHPALTRAFAGTRSVRIPPRLWYCPGPMLGEAVRYLAEARQ